MADGRIFTFGGADGPRAWLGIVMLIATVFGMPASAQRADAACNSAFQQCVGGCRTTGVMNILAAQKCQSACSSSRARCLRGEGASPAAAVLTSDEAQLRPQSLPPTADAVTYAQPADLLYTGPVRFVPEWAKKVEPDDATPLSQEQSFRPSQVLRHDYSNPNRRYPAHEQVMADELHKEYLAIEKAGFMSLSCSYGPTVERKRYTSVTAWFGKRAVLSEQMLKALRKYDAIDVAFARCPATFGEAKAFARGEKRAPDAQDLAQADAAIKARTGQRFLLAAARDQNFKDIRPFFGMRIVPANEFNERLWMGSQGGSISIASAPPPEWNDEWTRLSHAGQKILYCGYGHKMEGRNGVIMQPISFWYESKPKALTPAVARHIEERNFPLTDVALDSCPAYLGEAIALADGSPAALATAKQAQVDAIKAARTLCDRLADQDAPAASGEPMASQMCKAVTANIEGTGKSEWQERSEVLEGKGLNEAAQFAKHLAAFSDGFSATIGARVTDFRKHRCDPIEAGKRWSCSYTIAVSFQLSGPMVQKHAFMTAPLSITGLSNAEFVSKGGGRWVSLHELRGGNSFSANAQRELGGYTDLFGSDRNRLYDEERARRERREQAERNAMDNKCGAFKLCSGGW